MSKLVTFGNIAVFEYPPTQNVEEFEFDSEAILWVHGYEVPLLFDKPIRCCKKFDTKLKGYTLLGKHTEAVKRVKNIPYKLTEAVNLDCAVFFIKPYIPETEEEAKFLENDNALNK